METQRKGLYKISYDKSDINFDHLRRNRAFYQGVNIQMNEETTDKGDLIGFSNLPNILPVRPKAEWALVNYEELMATTASEEEQKE